MHMVWSSVTTGAEMWVGGAAASGDISTLTRNGISSTLAAAKTPPVVRDSRLNHLATCDGTSVVTGHTTFAEAMTIAGLVISALLAGARVLSSCKNGAHRSPFWAALILMLMTGRRPGAIAQYLSSIRAIIDLSSHHPRTRSSRYARPEITPLQWLEQNYDKIYEVYSKTWSKYNFRLNNLLTPWEFLARAGELGFMAKAGEWGAI